ncbi:hypothetical protein [Mycobacterium sp. 1245852.3]|uniref:hypothetical protein n=1 Tax=Mycobacterium sp. 1245852.3 TaxID=1856860 RepID=UPI0018D4AFF6|nr:hypothetical protein [Mycobacterium sp. 1245852.3]
MFEEAGDVIIQLRPVELYSTFVLSRDDLLAVMERLVDAVTSADEEAGRALVRSRGSVDVEHVIEGWTLSVERGTVILDVAPRNLGGHYVLSLEQASRLWRSLAAAYWLADDQIQEMLWQALIADDDSSEDSL